MKFRSQSGKFGFSAQRERMKCVMNPVTLEISSAIREFEGFRVAYSLQMDSPEHPDSQNDSAIYSILLIQQYGDDPVEGKLLFDVSRDKSRAEQMFQTLCRCNVLIGNADNVIDELLDR